MGSSDAISPENVALANILLKRHSQFLLPQVRIDPLVARIWGDDGTHERACELISIVCRD